MYNQSEHFKNVFVSCSNRLIKPLDYGTVISVLTSEADIVGLKPYQDGLLITTIDFLSGEIKIVGVIVVVTFSNYLPYSYNVVINNVCTMFYTRV